MFIFPFFLSLFLVRFLVWPETKKEQCISFIRILFLSVNKLRAHPVAHVLVHFVCASSWVLCISLTETALWIYYVSFPRRLDYVEKKK